LLLGVLAPETTAAALLYAIAAALSSFEHRSEIKQLNTNAKENYTFIRRLRKSLKSLNKSKPDTASGFGRANL